jgi:hypothetical protein
MVNGEGGVVPAPLRYRSIVWAPTAACYTGGPLLLALGPVAMGFGRDDAKQGTTVAAE